MVSAANSPAQGLISLMDGAEPNPPTASLEGSSLSEDRDPREAYQLRAMAQMRAAFAAGARAVMLQMATGAGKTHTARAVIQSALSRGGVPAWFVVDRIALVSQTLAVLDAAGIPAGVIQADHPRRLPHAPVQVASAQTLGRRVLPTDLRLIIVDEAHIVHRSVRALIEANPGARVIGLSATPFTAGLGKLFDSLVVGATPAELTELGFLVPAVVYAPSEPDLDGVGVRRGTDGQVDYVQAQLGRAMDKPELVGDVVQTWAKVAGERQTLVFASTIGHSQHLAAEFARVGVRSAHIDAYSESESCAQTIERFKRAEVQVLCSVGKVTTGFDAPNAGCIIVARPTKSLSLHLQIIGRGLRVDGRNIAESAAAGKPDCIVLDHAGNTLRLGFPTDPLPEELDDGKRKATGGGKTKPPRRCDGEGCARLMPHSVYVCPDCGHDHVKRCKDCGTAIEPGQRICPACDREIRRSNAIEHVEGELVQISGARREAKRAVREEQQRWWSQLLTLAEQRGKRRGWAAHTYRDRWGAWPNGLMDTGATPEVEVLSFVRAKAVAYAKALKAQEARA